MLEKTTVDNETIDKVQFDRFAARIQGTLIDPSDEAYDEARSVWNGMIDRYPALIVSCASTSDVVAAVNFARENKLRVAVRGGGHNVAGLGVADGGLVIDLTQMNSVEVDPKTQLVKAGGGATIGAVDNASQAYGLVVPLGVVSATGIAGLTLGGGLGWLRNKYGLSCDNLLAAEVVTADGQIIYASEDMNSDLLWGLRGGGGNFGIVTRFEYQAYRLGPEVAFTFVFHNGEGENMTRAFRYWRDYCATIPDEVSTLAASGIIPAHPELFPEGIQGKPFVLIGAMYAGPVEEGMRVMEPLRTFAEPLIDFSGIMPYREAQVILDEDYPDGMRYYWKSLNLSRLDNEVLDRLVGHARRQPSRLSTMDLWHIGGAVRRVTDDESAFHGRQAAFLLNPESNWEDPANDELNIAWVRDTIADMQKYSDGSRYLNFPGFQEEGDDMMRKAFGNKYQRLAELKHKYDPTNFFCLNQNIKPKP